MTRHSRIVAIVLSYAVFASLWILVSDRMLAWLMHDSAHIALASILKGWGFVAVTSLLLYGLLRRQAGPATEEASGFKGLPRASVTSQ